jgi:hypothetical protein
MNNDSIEELNSILNENKILFTNPDHFDLLIKLNNIEKKLSKLTSLENKALTSININDSFLAQELAEIINLEIENLKEELEQAKKYQWTQFDRQLFAKYTENIQKLKSKKFKN